MSGFLPTPWGMSRRHFLNHLTTASIALPAAHWLGALQAHAQSPKKTSKSCILLWMGGGPSHMDTWDLKPDSEKNGGPFRPIATSATGVTISEHLPTIAKQMKHLSVIRSLNSKEGNHDRGTYMMHTGYQPNPTVVHPSFGAICSNEIGSKLDSLDLPHTVSINSPGVGGGFLGMAHSPFVVNSPTSKIANLNPPDDVVDARLERRLGMLNLVEKNFASSRRGQMPIDHQAVYNKTVRLMTSSHTDAFRLDKIDQATRDRYGKGSFGQGCLMALELVKRGVTYVEVSLGGWDTHANAFEQLSTRLLPELDKGMGSLVEDLAKTGLLDKTMVVWMGEFGRTPRINQNAGRDHWPRCWSVVMGGGGLKGGQAVGSTDVDGVEVTDQPIDIMDVVATMAKGMDLPLKLEYTTPMGRPYKLVDEPGKPIPQLV